MEIREMTQEEKDDFFGNGFVTFGMKPPTFSAQNSAKPQTSSSPEPQDLQNLPEDPIKGVERGIQERLKAQSTTGNQED